MIFSERWFLKDLELGAEIRICVANLFSEMLFNLLEWGVPSYELTCAFL